MGEVITAHKCQIPMISCTFGSTANAPTLVDRWVCMSQKQMDELLGKLDALLHRVLHVFLLHASIDDAAGGRRAHECRLDVKIVGNSCGQGREGQGRQVCVCMGA